MGYRNQAQEAAAQAAARMENAKRETIQGVYNRHQDFVRCEANERAIIEAIIRWTQNPDVLPTAELFEILIEADPNSITGFARQPVERTKEQIVEEILSLLESKNGGRDGKYDSYNLRSEEARMKSWTLDALRTRLNEIKVKQKMSSTPVSVLKQMVADARPAPGYPMLPKQLFENGRTVTVNALYLKALDPYSLKRICRIYSTEAVNQRLAEK